MAIKSASNSKSPRRSRIRTRKRSAKYQLSKDADINYKNVSLLQRFVTDRGKVVARRISGVNAKEQRALITAIKRARYLGLLPVGSSKRR